MRDHFVDGTEQFPSFTLVFVYGLRFSSGTNQLIQFLCVTRIYIQKFGQVLRVFKEKFAPLLGLPTYSFFITFEGFHLLKLQCQRISVHLADYFADELHLTSSCLKFPGGQLTKKLDSLSQTTHIIERNFFKLSVWQACEFFSQRLELQHIPFFRTFRSIYNATIDPVILLLKGVFVCHVIRV